MGFKNHIPCTRKMNIYAVLEFHLFLSINKINALGQRGQLGAYKTTVEGIDGGVLHLHCGSLYPTDARSHVIAEAERHGARLSIFVDIEQASVNG